MRSRRCEDGATGLEYAALLLLGAVLVMAVVVPVRDPGVEDEVRRAVCRMLNLDDEECDELGDGPGTPEPSESPPPSESPTEVPPPTPGPPAVPWPPDGPPPDDADDSDGPEDSEEPDDPDEPEELNRLGIPCLVDRDVAGLEALGIIRFVAGDGRIGYVIDQVGTGTFRVTFYGDVGGGLGAMGGAAPGFPLRGPFGFIESTVGAGGAVSFDFDSREQAEAFVGSLVGGSGPQVPGILGGPGQLIGGLLSNFVGGGPDPEHSFTHVVVGGRASGNGGYNVGANAGVDGVGALEGVLSHIHLDGPFDGFSIFTGQLESVGSLRLGLAGLRWADGTGAALRYRVMWDEQGRPIRLSLIQETVGVEGDSFAAGGGTNRWGSGALSEMEHGITISERHLDLTDPQSLELFNRTFVNVPGMYAYPRHLVPTTVAEPGGEQFWWQRLLDRISEDGVFTDYEYAETVTTGEGGGGRGNNGVMVDGTVADRRLVSATIIDQHWDDPVPQDFGACFSDDPAWGVPGGAGDPVGSPP